MIKQVGKFEFDENSLKYKKFKKEIPIIVANEAVNHFKEGFLPQNAGRRTDASKDGWAKKRSGKPSYLTLTGTMRKLMKDKETFDIIVIKPPVESDGYAYKHNFGVEGQVKREFLGDSKELVEKNYKTIEKELAKVMQ